MEPAILVSAAAKVAVTSGTSAVVRRLFGSHNPSLGISKEPVRVTSRLRLRQQSDALLESDVQRLVRALLLRITDADEITRGLEEGTGVQESLVAVLLSLDGIDLHRLADHNFDASRLYSTICSSDICSAHHEKFRNRRARLLFDDILAECCTQIVEHFSRSETFVPITQLKQLEELEKLQQSLGAINKLLETGGRLSQSESEFDFIYRRDVVQKYDEITLFGLKLERSKQEYRLTSAYVNLSIQLESKESNEGKPRFTRSGRTIEQVLAGNRLVAIEGPAGSGKTTLLRRIAIHCANGSLPDEIADWNGRMPFYLPARLLDPQNLPVAEAMAGFSSPNIAKKPPDWVTELLLSGRAIVLVDGIDELPETGRASLIEWVEKRVRAYPQCTFIVSARPTAISSDLRYRLRSNGFVIASIDPMTSQQVGEFISRWHEPDDWENLPAKEKDLLRNRAEGMHTAMVARRDLQRLATTPLLCAMLCALNYNNNKWIPRGRTQLYKDTLEMLFERREREQEIVTSNLRLDYIQIDQILRHVAFWMTTEGSRWIHKEIALLEVEDLLSRLKDVTADGSTVTAQRVLDYIVERSGVLQEPTADTLEFRHPSFQDFLAAAQVNAKGHVGLLAKEMDNPLFQDVIIMAVGLAQADEQRQKRLLDTLIGSSASRAGRWLLLAAAIADLSFVDDDIVQQINRNTRGILPPKDMDDANTLAFAGGFVLDLLGEMVATRLSELTPDHRAATVHVATTIAREESLALLKVFRSSDDDAVQLELIQGWARFPDPEAYVDTVLQHLPTPTSEACRHISVRSTTTLSLAHRVSHLESLAVDLPEDTVVDLSTIGLLPNLIVLDCVGCRLSGSIKPGNTPLIKELSVAESDILDLSPVQACLSTIRSLNIEETQISSLAEVRGATALQELYARGSLVEDLTPLETCRGLRILDLVGTMVTDLRAVGDLELLEKLEICGLHISDFEPLTSLKNLVELDISGTEAQSLTWLKNCRSLKILRIDHTRISDITPVLKLPEIEEVTFDSTPVSKNSARKLMRLLEEHGARASPRE